MLTLKKHPDNIELCTLKKGKKKISVYWHPVKNKDLRLAVTDVHGFDNEMFRDRFQLSEAQSQDILNHMHAGTTRQRISTKTVF